MKQRIDVCIASYKRPAGLKRLLQSLVAQETGGRFEIAAHVVDNDAERSAEGVVSEVRRAGLDVTYDVEPVQNISLARNRSMARASGDWIATIDDDLHPDRGWLAAMLDTAERFGADVVHGRSVQVFLPGTPDYVRRFHIKPQPPTGSTDGYVLSTGNSMFRRSLIDGLDGPFNPRLGRTGGEDTQFFDQLVRRGAKTVYCREAKVISEVSAERSTLRWILRRRMRLGSNLVVVKGVYLEPRDCVRGVFIIASRVAFSALCFVGATFVFCSRASRESFVRGRLVFVTALLTAAHLYGRLLRHFGGEYEEYTAR